jgi:hypothetical protein
MTLRETTDALAGAVVDAVAVIVTPDGAPDAICSVAL